MQRATHRWTVEGDDLSPSTACEICAVLREDGVVALPTETFYGLGASCRSPAALGRLLRLKERPAAMPLLLLVADVAMARELCPSAPEQLELLAERFWPGPLTLVLPAPPWLPEPITQGGRTVAVRHPSHPVAEAIVRELGDPITGTSANRSGRPPVRTAAELELAPGETLDGIVDAGRTPGGAPSTLLDVTRSPARVLREGAIGTDRIAESIELRLV